MNKYSIDTNYRIYIYFIIAVISISISPHVTFFEKLFGYSFSVTPFMLFCGLYWLFNNYLWSFFGFRHFFKVPNLNGKWEGTITLPVTEYRKQERIINVVLFVTQNWSTIDLVLKGQETVSSALTTHISIRNPDNISIKWIYKVKGRTGLEPINHASEGVTELFLTTNSSSYKMEGFYYSNIGRRGYLQLTKSM